MISQRRKRFFKERSAGLEESAHGPAHASGFNPIEICFSIMQRKAQTPKRLDFPRPEAAAELQ